MIHQVMFSGSVRKTITTFVPPSEVKDICDYYSRHDLTGLTLYAEGSILCLIECEDLVKLNERVTAITKSGGYNNIAAMFQRTSPCRNFTDMKIGLRRRDAKDAIKNIPQTFRLTQESLETVLPAALSLDFKVLLRTFSRVNNLVAC